MTLGEEEDRLEEGRNSGKQEAYLEATAIIQARNDEEW